MLIFLVLTPTESKEHSCSRIFLNVTTKFTVLVQLHRHHRQMKWRMRLAYHNTTTEITTDNLFHESLTSGWSDKSRGEHLANYHVFTKHNASNIQCADPSDAKTSFHSSESGEGALHLCWIQYSMLNCTNQLHSMHIASMKNLKGCSWRWTNW